ncbi:hypothetical protein BDV59DRAFT_160431 [Aspergillus ambiguus]|uniref:uncharacterized protein n=1 Tax=Aspergillus ambiguus TaxID=176160 RepID=UPI003CCD4011
MNPWRGAASSNARISLRPFVLRIDLPWRQRCFQLNRPSHIPRGESHDGADAAVTLFVATVASKARLRHGLDGLFDRGAGAGRREGEVHRGGERGGGHLVLIWGMSDSPDD